MKWKKWEGYMKKLLRNTKRLLDKIFGSKVDEKYWQFRHIFGRRKWAEECFSEESLDHPHRSLMIDKIVSYVPIKTLLEIGCASGPNLYLLAQKLSGAELCGIDISKKAIETGNELLGKEGISNVKLYVDKADELGQFSDNSFDIVFTDAILIYVSPDKINKVIREMLRVARKAVVLCEQHTEREWFYNDKWIHNYRELLSKLVSPEKILFTKIPPQVWGGDWGKYGYIIEAVKK
jgi:ubiquinone/menaquinone biosynthesis C-methylase UbiE